MRCQFGDSGEMGPPAYNIWTSGSLQTPNILKNMTKPNDTTHNGSQNNIFTSCTAMLSTSYTTDSGSPSQKRKMLDSENEDFEERFSKMQRRKQLQKVAARVNLVVADDVDSGDEEDKMYEQMDWIEKESFLNLNMCNSSEKSDSGLNETNNTVSIPVSKCDDINSQSDIKDGKNVLLNKEIDDSDVMPFLKCDDQLDSVSSDSDDGEGDSMLNERKAVFLPRLKCKNERRRVLKITMAKIRDVDDPEAYLRRSVLIFNTVRILKGNNGDTRNADANEKYESMDVMYQNDNDSKHEIPSNIVECQYASSASNDGNFYNDPQLQGCENVSYPPNFNLSDDITSDKTVQTLPHNNGTSLCSLNDGSLNQAALPSSIVKQPSTLHPFSSQPSGLQYKNSNHSDDSKDDCQDSLPSGSSILDSVVYQSLKTYLET